MKPKDLKSPFSWKERRVLLQQGVLYIPDYYTNYSEFHLPTWEDPQLFGTPHPVHIEYCSGNGSWIAQRARENPDVNWIAVEKRFDRVRKIWSKKHNEGLENLLIVCGEALTFSREYLPDHSIAQIFVNFPDPWPKDRHAKHRLIQPPFVAELLRLLQAEGKATLVTDDLDYKERMQEAFATQQSFVGEEKIYHDTYGSSFFCDLWKEKGRHIHLLEYTAQLEGCTHGL